MEDARKRWWSFRAKPSLWASFIKAKYCVRSHPIFNLWASGETHAWKHMTQVMKVDTNLTWKINAWNCNFWWDNWPEKGTLATLFPGAVGSRKATDKEYMTEGTWNLNKLAMILDNHTVQHIANIKMRRTMQFDSQLKMVSVLTSLLGSSQKLEKIKMQPCTDYGTSIFLSKFLFLSWSFIMASYHLMR